MKKIFKRSLKKWSPGSQGNCFKIRFLESYAYPMNRKLRELSTKYIFGTAFSSVSKDGLYFIIKSYRWNGVYDVIAFTVGLKIDKEK